MPDTTSNEHSTMPTEPGWYNDAAGEASHQAYWDGEKWTGATRPVPPAPLTPTQHLHWVLSVVASGAALVAWYAWALWAALARPAPDIDSGSLVGGGAALWLVYGLLLMSVPERQRSSGMKTLITISTAVFGLTVLIGVIILVIDIAGAFLTFTQYG